MLQLFRRLPARFRLLGTFAAVAVLLSVIASGCGGTSSSTTAGSTSAANAAPPTHFTGAPIKISVATGINTTLGSFPQIFAGEKAAARDINAHGGLNGHELIVNTCNTQSTPSGEVACARQAVSDGSVAMVGDLVYTNPVGFIQTLQQAGIPDIGNYWSPNQQQLHNTFMLYNALDSGAACLDPTFDKSIGATKAVGVLVGLASSQATDALNRSLAKGLHNPIPIASSVGFAGSTTDFDPVVQRIADSGANLLLENITNPTSTALLTAATELGKKWNYCGQYGSVFGKLALGLGSAATGLYQVSPFPPLTAAAQYPILNTAISDLKAEQAAGDSAASLDPSEFGVPTLQGWFAVQELAAGVRTIHGPVTRASLMAAMNKLQLNLGGIFSIDFTKPVGTGAYARIYDPWLYIWHWDPSKKNWYLVPGVHTNSVAAAGACATASCS